MHPVHVGGYNKPSQDAIKGERKLNVTVIEHRCCIQHDFKNDDGGGGRAEQGNGSKFNHHRQNNFNRVKAGPGRYIVIKIGMMQAV